MERLAEVVGVKDDVAVLALDQALSPDMCALRMMSTDVFDSEGLRYGIPGTLMDPNPLPVTVGPKDSEFAPLVVLTPSPAEKGESGGPVIYRFNVIGILRAKHETFTAISLMVPRSKIVALLEELNLNLDGKVCNPVEAQMYTFDSVNAGVRIGVGGDVSEENARKVMVNQILESIKVAAARVGGDRLLNISVEDDAVRLESRTELPVGPLRQLREPIERKLNHAAISAAASEIVKNLEERLWDLYVEQGKTEGWWR